MKDYLNLDIADMQGEEWKQFEETEAKQYFVSTAGRIKSIKKTTGKEHIHKLGKHPNGYVNVRVPNTQYVHRIVLQAFKANPENKPTVNHIDGDVSNNDVRNLEWATPAEQDEHARRTGLRTPGNTPTIVLDSNGDVIARYNSTIKAMTAYQGREVHYNKSVQIIDNVIVMKEAYYNTLDDNELFVLVTNCFERMMEYSYVVDGQLFNTKEAASLIGCTQPTISLMTKDIWTARIKSHNVSRMSNILGIATDIYNVDSYELTNY